MTPEYERTQDFETTTKSTLNPEHKLRDLLNHLKQLGEPSLFNDINKAAIYCRENHDAVFVEIADTFDAPQFYNGQGHIDVNESKAILFEKNICKNKDTYSHNDNYYKRTFNSELRIAMATSLTKYPSYKKGAMGATSHEAMMLRGYRGFDIPLNVFGSFFNTHSFFQIKPYAIWR